MLIVYIVKVLLYVKRTIQFIGFISPFIARQTIWNINMAYHFIVLRQSITVLPNDDTVIPVNNYHLRYEGSQRAA